MATSGNTRGDETDDKVNAQLAAAEDHLVARYAHQGNYTEPEIRAQFQNATQHFADARVRFFLPILIERIVEDNLAHPAGHATMDQHNG